MPWKFGGLATALVLLIGAGSALAEPVPGGTLDVTTVPKFVTPLQIPPSMPTTGTANNYEIEVVQFEQNILPAGYNKTTVWGYGAIGKPATRTYPAHTIEAEVDTPVTVKWVNNLKDAAGNYLPHLLPVDQTLHWANPPQTCLDEMGMPVTGTDCSGQSQQPYLGPVPIITHLHGAHVGSDSDGYPEAWYLPKANNIPVGYATEGKEYNDINGGNAKGEGYAVFQYPNDQQATTLWFHDHSLGMTRANVYAGPVGFYLLRGGQGDVLENTMTKQKDDGELPSDAYEIPLVIQDKSFNANGSLFFPRDRAFFEGLLESQLKIPFIPDTALGGGMSDVSPIWNPEFFGNTIVVNGNTWPFLNVEPRQYRLRLLNGSDSRFFILTTPMVKGKPMVTFYQIGADGGFLPKPVALNQLLIGPAERADVIVDFSGLAGKTVTLLNIGPDEPFGGGIPGLDFAPSDPGTTGQVMQFRVSAAKVADPSTPVKFLGLPAPVQLPAVTAAAPRRLSLNEEESGTVFVPVDANGEYILDGMGNLREVSKFDPNAAPFGPSEAILGTVDAGGFPVPREWMEGITENPALDSTEVWEVYNFTADAHPIHIHLVQFEILNRQKLVTNDEGMAEPPVALVGKPRSPEPWETGRKDTVIVYPGEVARVKAHFDIAGLFVWHCHILSHEDNEMMRPYYVGPTPPAEM
jgi:FtsP/CotA-like multicopper oxidase with cupredoxin domain